MNSKTTPLHSRAALAVVAMVLLVAACGSYEPGTVGQGADTNGAATSTSTTTTSASAVGASSFTAEVWADNWFALYVDGELVGEDSVPITTERSFNSETITFEATYPFTIGIEAKDFKETDSGLEYIGTDRQQMGDGGMIAQITDNATGQVVAVTDGSWTVLVVQRAPLNTECEKAADPDTACQHETIEIPADWGAPGFDDSGWVAATEWSAADVGPKDGYDEISWDPAAKLVWGSDLKIDNTILLRATVDA
ncbi:MAG: PEBP family protein [Acidimicrobiia bacterium]